jgi:hypothetical protein
MKNAVFMFCLISTGCTSVESDKASSCQISCKKCEDLTVLCKIDVDTVEVEVTGS